MASFRKYREQKPGYPFLTMGVILPLSTLLIEATSGMCAEGIFDPLPSVLHVVLVALVPAANILVWLRARRNLGIRDGLLGILNGIGSAVSAYYTILFLPLLPFAVPAVIVGIGLLPLSPLLSFIASVRAYLFLSGIVERPTRLPAPGTLWGLILGVLALVGADLPGTITRVGLSMAASQDSKTGRDGIALLRTLGSEDELLRACWQAGRRGRFPLVISIPVGEPVEPSKAREIYYRVYGRSFSAVPQPRLIGRSAAPWTRWGFDPHQGGETVGGRLGGLSLESSRIDGSIDADAALAYLGWTIEIRNDSPNRHEARAQIQLPPGAVVSRLTLWVHGEEREAAFAGRAQVRQAYEKVVKARRDPVLVTTKGRDRVLVQCFPVEPGGGLMKFRLGITAPLALVEKERGLLRLPAITDRNFDIRETTAHLVWIESRADIKPGAPPLQLERPRDDLFAVRGALTDMAATGPAGIIDVRRPPLVVSAWTEDHASNEPAVVVQTLEEIKTAAPSEVVFVIDGSASMAPFQSDIVAALAALPSGIRHRTILASEPMVERGPEAGPPDKAWLTGVFKGGCDNLPALMKAWDVESGAQDHAIVWIHGPQPVALTSPEPLRRMWERRRPGPKLYEIQVSPGPNVLLEKLDGIPSIIAVPRAESVREDLERLFSSWKGDSRTITAVRERRLRGDGPEPDGKKTSSHLARLWANDEVSRILGDSENDGRVRATELAVRYHLVTSVTGAVVLETAEQFREAGLTPVQLPGEPLKPGVPVVPEPEEWLLMAAVAMVLLWVLHRRRRQWATA